MEGDQVNEHRKPYTNVPTEWRVKYDVGIDGNVTHAGCVENVRAATEHDAKNVIGVKYKGQSLWIRSVEPITEQVIDADGKPVIERVKELRIGASLPVGLIREAYEAPRIARTGRMSETKWREKAALEVGRECLINAADERILMIARKEATLRGYSDTGITFHTEKCAGCEGTGRQHVQGKKTGPGFECKDCRGDGFAPPWSEMPEAARG